MSRLFTKRYEANSSVWLAQQYTIACLSISTQLSMQSLTDTRPPAHYCYREVVALFQQNSITVDEALDVCMQFGEHKLLPRRY